MRSPVSKPFANHRERVYTTVADAVAEALERERVREKRRFTDYRLLSKRVGRQMGRTLGQILRERDTTVSTLADIALATGHRLRIEFEPIHDQDEKR